MSCQVQPEFFVNDLPVQGWTNSSYLVVITTQKIIMLIEKMKL